MTTEKKEAAERLLQGLLVEIRAKIVSCQELAEELGIGFELIPNVHWEEDGENWAAWKKDRFTGLHVGIDWSESSWCIEYDGYGG